MKKLNYFVLLCGLLLINSCKKGEEKPIQNDIIGKWKLKSVTTDCFDSTGKLAFTNENSSGGQEWVFTEETISIYYTDLNSSTTYKYSITNDNGKMILSLYHTQDDVNSFAKFEIKSINSEEMVQIHPRVNYTYISNGVSEEYTCTETWVYYKVK